MAVEFQSISSDLTTYSKLKISRIFIQKCLVEVTCKDYFCLIVLLSIILANNWCKEEGRDVPFMACLADWLVSAVEMCCVNFMSELSRHKLSSQLTFTVSIALTSSHDKHGHCIAWGLPSPFQWKRITYVTLAHLLRYGSLTSERNGGGGKTPLASLWWQWVSILIKKS